MQERQETIVKEFLITDKNGEVHKAIMVGVLNVIKFTEYKDTTKVIECKDKLTTITTEWEEKCVRKDLSLGLAITNPTDEYNYSFGVQVAKGRALKENKRLGHIASNARGMLGTSMCIAIMEQQINFIQNNQDLFVKVKQLPIDVTKGKTGIVVTQTV